VSAKTELVNRLHADLAGCGFFSLAVDSYWRRRIDDELNALCELTGEQIGGVMRLVYGVLAAASGAPSDTTHSRILSHVRNHCDGLKSQPGELPAGLEELCKPY
jgi:hypothetical protein